MVQWHIEVWWWVLLAAKILRGTVEVGVAGTVDRQVTRTR